MSDKLTEDDKLITEFIEALDRLCQKFHVTLGHEFSQGAFILTHGYFSSTLANNLKNMYFNYPAATTKDNNK